MLAATRQHGHDVGEYGFGRDGIGVKTIGVILLAAAWLAGTGAATSAGLDGDVLAEINWVRAHPRAYADELRSYRDSFEGLIAHPDDVPDGLMTREGRRAVDEAIAYMEAQPPLPPLAASAVLASGAGDLVADQASSGRLGHYTADGLSPGARVRRHGGDIYVGEVIAYGPADARGVVRQLIVDDGVPQRGHRLLLFSDRFRFAGATCGAHRRYGAMCVVDLSATQTGAPQIPGAGG